MPKKYSILLEGPIGSGKTHSLRTLVEAGLEIFVLATEPGIHTVLGDLPEDKCHWKYISPAKISTETLIDNAEKINKYPMDQLPKLPGLNRRDYDQFIQVLCTYNEFVCDRNGKNYGPIEELNESCAFIIDGLSGLSTMAMDLVVGGKPIKTLPEWGVAIDNLRRTVTKIVYDTRCTFVLLAHVSRQINEVTGMQMTTVDTLGNKLAPELVKPFDEVIYAQRQGKDFSWSTIEPNVDLKTRTLGWSDELEPTFAQFDFDLESPRL